jgi:hypothetical protein
MTLTPTDKLSDVKPGGKKDPKGKKNAAMIWEYQG